MRLPVSGTFPFGLITSGQMRSGREEQRVTGGSSSPALLPEIELEWSSPRNIAVLGLTEKSRKCHCDLVNISFSISSLLPCFRGFYGRYTSLSFPHCFLKWRQECSKLRAESDHICFEVFRPCIPPISLFKEGLEKNMRKNNRKWGLKIQGYL